MADTNRLLEALTAEGLLPASEDKKAPALRELAAAIDDYRHHLKPTIATQREELRRLADALADASELFAALSPQSIQLYCNIANAPLGESTIPLRRALDYARRAASTADESPNKMRDYQLVVLACDVGRVLRDHIDIEPTVTRDCTDLNVGRRGGAAYARLLRKILFVAGVTPPTDLHPLMKAGKTLLENPRGDLL